MHERMENLTIKLQNENFYLNSFRITKKAEKNKNKLLRKNF